MKTAVIKAKPHSLLLEKETRTRETREPLIANFKRNEVPFIKDWNTIDT